MSKSEYEAAKLYHEIDRFADAVKHMESFKGVIDPMRQSYATLEKYREMNIQRGHPARATVIREYMEKINSDIITNANRAVQLIDKYLLPNTSEFCNDALLYKIKGDMLRYITERSSDDESTALKEKADASYHDAFTISKQNLSNTDPILICTVLNYSVFKHDIMNDIDSALEMALEMITKLEMRMDIVNRDNNIKSLYDLFKENVNNWTPFQ